MQKIILYYKFVPVEDAVSVMFWQKALCEKLELKGRIIISKHGINGTLGGELKNLRLYKRSMNEHPKFKGMMYKWSDGSSEHFPKLSVKVRDEIVTFGAGDELEVDENGVVGGGKHLKPEQVHELVEEKGDEVVFMDGRNAYESEIGQFKGAIKPNVKTAKEFDAELDTPEMQKLKDKPIVTYCTGGIRCEILSSLMKKKGFTDVYQIDGGIVKYGEKYKDEGFWEGKLYVFDKRMRMGFSDKAVDIGECVHCGSKTSNHINCSELKCNRQVLVCEKCLSQTTICNKHSVMIKN